ncbi:MAG: thiamine diphosphokinase [Anaerococcus sp.]|nr:thiamine diphosphokinase [Anaerococcus sp.]
MARCFIFAGGSFDGFFDQIKEGDLVIGADKGYTYARENDIDLDYIIGDFDSSTKPLGDNVLILKPIKDYTDTVEAINLARKKGYKKIIIYGGLGGRESHTIANIRALYHFKKKGIDISLKAKGKEIFIIDDKLSYPYEGKDFYVSIFSLTNITRGLTIKGLFYELNSYDLSMDDLITVSNQTKGRDFSISIKEGALVVVFEDFNL